MNRLQHLLWAQTQYNLHSPFVYRLYTEVLTSRARGEGCPRGSRYRQVVWRLRCHFGAEAEPAALGRQEATLLRYAGGRALVVDRPHRAEADWLRLQADPDYQVTLDLYSVGIAIHNPHLSRQHFILR